MDYYRILGVNKNATPEEIKKAYKIKVKQHHPDRGGDAEHFKRINEAYEILSNSDKRSAYDNPSPDFNFNSSHFRNSDPFQNGFADIFAQQFGSHPRRQPKNRDIVLGANIELADVFDGKTLLMQYRLQSGKIETVEVIIPPGARHGDRIRYENLGDDGNKRFPRGDLQVKVSIKSNHTWKREDDNLLLHKTINVFDLLTGCVILIKTLDNKTVKLNIPQGTKPGTTLSITGYGLPNLNNNNLKGNLYVKISAEMPKIKDDIILQEIASIKQKIYKD